MSSDGHQTCPHCRAIVQSTICDICGRSAYEEVAPRPASKKVRWWHKLEDNELRGAVTTVALVLALAGAVAFVLTRSEPEPDAAPLPPPASTTTGDVPIISESRPPSVVGGEGSVDGESGQTVVPGAPREVTEGLSPWEAAPPIDYVTGTLLDEELDYAADIDRVAEILDSFPDRWSLESLDPPELLSPDGPVDAALVEATQPFVARTIRRPSDDLLLGEVWLIASAGGETGNSYLAAARARWDVTAAVDQFSPGVGLRLWRLASDDTFALWASDLADDSFVVIHAPVDVTPRVLTELLDNWRDAIS